MKINLKQLETFVLVADLGSFRSAAERLSTTQPNISSRIASLEASLEVVLMERDAGSVRLTSKGHELLGYARNVLSSVDQFIEVANGESAFDGVVRLGVNEMVVHTWLRDFMQAFKARFPNVLIELSVDLSLKLETDLAERNIDLAFQSGPFARKASGEHCLGLYPIIWVASPSTNLASDRPVSAEELTKFPILTHARRTRPYEDVAAHFAQWPKLKTRLVPSSNLSACLQMTVDGYGVAALLAPMVEQELANGQLIKVDYPWVPEPLSFAARYDRSKSSSVVQSAAEIAHHCAAKHYHSFQSSFSQDYATRTTDKKAS
ncbi:MAG: DNA-binding transcriptional LysR family regulator [Arenicella sp.]